MPRELSLHSAREALDGRNGAASDLPLVVKPRGQIGRGTGVSFVSSREQLDAAYEWVRSHIGEPLITEYVPGPTDHMRAVHLLFDRETRLIGYFVMQKLCLWPHDVGVSAAAISTHETSMVRALLPLFEHLKWRGPADAEFKIDHVSNQPVLLEINPRFSGAVSFPLRCGVNFADMFCQAAIGNKLPAGLRPQYEAGLKYVNPAPYVRGSWHRARQRGFGYALSRARIELSGKRVRTVYQLSDIAPTIGKALLQLREPSMDQP